jgi:hypothetical protein
MSSDAPTPESSPDEKRSPAVRLALGLAPILGILIGALVSIAVVARANSGTPAPQDWQAAAEHVRAQRAAGALIVFAPGWIDPVGRQYLGDQMSVEMASRMDAARYERIWELSVGGARAPESRGLSAASTKHFGPLRVREYQQTPAQVSEDFTANWTRAAVSGQMQGRPNLSLQEVGFEAHRCIKVVPRPDQTVSMRFENVTLGSHIVGYVGLADVFTRRDIREPGQLELLVNDKSMTKLRAGVDDGWKRFEVQTVPGQGTVEFRLTALGANARDRRICFAAEARL